MERVIFLVEDGGERVPCLLNPETVVARRRAGVQARAVPIGGGVADAPLLCDGGGVADWQFDLLFDVDLVSGAWAATTAASGPTAAVSDVRELTAPLAALAENAWRDGRPRAPRVRLIWGKRWNLPGVITALAERFEYFAADGAPRRSWMRLRLARVAESDGDQTAPPPLDDQLIERIDDGARAPDDEQGAHQVIGADGSGERLDTIAERVYGDASYWRLIATYNDIDDPDALVDGALIELPSSAWLERELASTRVAAGGGDGTSA